MTIKELREKRRKLAEDARAELDKITDKTPAEEAKTLEARFDEMMAKHDKLSERIEREERAAAALAALEEEEPKRSGREDRRGGGGGEDRTDPKKAAEERQDAFVMAMRFGTESLEPEQRKLVAELRAQMTPEMRAQSTSGSAGGYTIPEGFLPEITKSMAAWGPMLDPGVTRVIDTATGNDLPWPTVDDTSNEGALLSENTQVTEQDVTFGQKTLNAYLYTSKLVRVSIQLLQDSAFNMDSLLNELFGERIGRAANRHLTVGTGTSQPNGIVTASSAGYTAASATAISFDDMIELEHSVDPAYRAAPGCRWQFHDSTLKALRKIKDGDSNYIWQPASVTAGAPATILNHPYTVNQAMAEIDGTAKSVIFGDHNKYIVRRVLDFMMLRLVERYADYLQVGFLAFNRIDGELADTAAVKHLVHPSA